MLLLFLLSERSYALSWGEKNQFGPCRFLFMLRQPECFCNGMDVFLQDSLPTAFSEKS